MSGTSRYHEFVADTPNHLVTGVIETVPCARSAALDLGAGNLRDSKFLKKAGFKRVVAVDYSEESIPYAVEGIELIIAPIQEYRPSPNTFNFVVACNSLFFLSKPEVEELMRTMYRALRPRGVFAFNLLGEQDPWAEDPSKSAFSEPEVLALVRRFKTVTFGEMRKILPTPDGGQKFWHQWVPVLRKP